MLPYPDAGRCPRCGGVIAATTDEDLVHCTALAKVAV